jgi:hypothetical protein
MPLSGLQAQDITEAILHELVTAQVPEGKTIDYKAGLPGNADSARRDFLADLCSFANASGGYLVYGMEEAEGLPTNLLGLLGDIDQAIQRLESMARDGIRPAIPGLEFIRVTLANGNSAIVLVVPKSWNPPHQVIFQKDYRFYTRGAAGRQHFDVDELRRIVLLSQEIGERIRQFRAGRVAAVMNGETPVALAPGARQILHFVPLVAFGAGTSIDMKPMFAKRELLVSAMNHGGSVRHNIDGLLAFSDSDTGHLAYAQLYRNGIIEIAALQPDRTSRAGRPILPSLSFEEDIFAQTKAALAVLEGASVSPPLAMMLSFTGIKGWEMGVRDTWGTRGHMGGFDRDPLLVPELLLQSIKADEVRALVKPVIDATWNAAGYAKSDYYDVQGNWVGEQGR